ncbi:MAG: CBS domain-containing protein [Candidatus Aenigmarchaeota archaeon]|nr:CBS domain-containing protein [Candidatus Aenigmarchaeota archaeon]
MKLVKDYMKSKVRKLRPTYSIFKAAEILSKYHISGAPVVRGNRVVGIITETDIIRFMKLDMSKTHSELAAEPHALSVLLLSLIKDHLDVKKHLEELSKIRVKDFMTKGIVSISPNESIIEAANLLEKHSIDRLPVIESGKLVGIISRCDLIRALVD